MPLGTDGRRWQFGATDFPSDEVVDALQFAAGGEVELKVWTESEAKALSAAAPASHQLNRVTPRTMLRTGTEIPMPDGSLQALEDAALFERVRTMIDDAIAARASDIHVEPLHQRVRLRYRIDGGLVDRPGPAKELQLPFVSRLKIMADISIAEKRVPQDGRIAWNSGGRAIDLRVSTLPTTHGESVVMRILDQESVRPRLDDLGLSPADDAALRQLTRRHDGIVLVTGPTGSGKTTTLYSCLQVLNQRERKIITVEDPIEYQLAGVNQVLVRPESGLTFASALRALLRQSPNVIMVGEIRDTETAEMVVHAALTGHLVFSTLHTNDAVGAVTRLIDLGIKPYLVAAALRGSVAQRLVRRICPACRQAWQPTRQELHTLAPLVREAATAGFAKGRGCAQCHGTGYCGRLGVFETLVVDARLERLISTRPGVHSLRVAARANGLRTLCEDAFAKAKCGLTTLAEVASIATSEASPPGGAPI